MIGKADPWLQVSRTEHQAVARIIGYALTLRSDDACRAAAFVIRNRLNPEDRMVLVSSVLESLPDAELAGVLRHFARRTS